MDKETRNKLQNATQAARQLLTREYQEQLEGVFDVHPDGTIAAEPGEHLDAGQKLVRRKVVSAISHEQAKAGDAASAVQGYLRETAFTTLNRFVAFKMLEARKLVQECVSRGEESSGFKEFCGLAPGLLALPDHGYQLYLECLCDEIGTEVKILFDRDDPASLLWPRRQPLLDLLTILNQRDLALAWAEDETIGWVYQYFNSQEERREMREHAAPRNSHELAVRNQFFTPRYVVCFLSDNTLGRIWYEMRKGGTRLKEECKYLVRRVVEIFLKEGEKAPRSETDNTQQKSQEELLREPVHIPHRKKKDPRDLKILDPACGSGHFLLYCFFLLLIIYEEAWGDPESPTSEVTGKTLRQDYPNLEALRAAIPELILRHNLHGIDIDTRCAQIAALAFWMRAQKAWADLSVPRSQRPPIRKTNIVVAQPMPGEQGMLDEFIARHLDGTPEDRATGALLRNVFERMKLAGEAGSLLKIEEDIKADIEEARESWGQGGTLFQMPLLSDAKKLKQQEIPLAFSNITDAKFWDDAEQRTYQALHDYAGRAHNGRRYQRRLFVEDAEEGFALIDLCRKKYDVALMNPPFGKCSDVSADYFNSAYADFKADVGIAFVDRFLGLLNSGGSVGAITSRAFLANDSFKEWRAESLLDKRPINCFLDLGYGVLDDAMVEAAAYVVEASKGFQGPRLFVRVLESRDKEGSTKSFFETGKADKDLLFFIHELPAFKGVPLAVICYWLPASLLQKLQATAVLPRIGGAARHGLVTTDDFQFLRLAWEVPSEAMRGPEATWRLLAKGGEYQPYWDDLHVCVEWAQNGKRLKTFLAEKRLKTQGSADWSPWLNHSEYYMIEGLTYPERTTSDFCPRVLPKGVIFSSTGQAIQFGDDRALALAYLCGSFTRFFKLVVESFVGSGDNAFPGSAAKHYRSGLLNQLPGPLRQGNDNLTKIAKEGIAFSRFLFSEDETTRGFCPPLRDGSILELKLRNQVCMLDSAVSVICNSKIVEDLVANTFSLSKQELEIVDEIIGPHPQSYLPTTSVDPNEVERLWSTTISQLVEVAIQRDGPRRQLTKKSFIADRKLELICHVLKAPPATVAHLIKSKRCVDEPSLREAAYSELSLCVGVAYGRWDVRFATGESSVAALPDSDAFAPLPICPPGMLQNAEGMPAKSDEVSNDYPLRISWGGILVDDPGHVDDIEGRMRDALKAIWKDRADVIYQELVEIFEPGANDLRAWFRRSFFTEHISRYSKSRRNAPIFWCLSTASSGYSIWLYYHRFDKDTLYKVLNDYVKPKVAHEERQLTRLRQEAGQTPTSSQRKEIDKRETFVEELKNFAAELARVAPLWNPNLNDGVIINFAPVWRLVSLRSWQKECKDCWDSLVVGEYDWSHLAMHLWPERVVPKCAADRSLAITHELEAFFWEESDGDWEPVRRKKQEIDALIAERTSAAAKAALVELLGAPSANPGKKKRTKAK